MTTIKFRKLEPSSTPKTRLVRIHEAALSRNSHQGKCNVVFLPNHNHVGKWWELYIFNFRFHRYQSIEKRLYTNSYFIPKQSYETYGCWAVPVTRKRSPWRIDLYNCQTRFFRETSSILQFIIVPSTVRNQEACNMGTYQTWIYSTLLGSWHRHHISAALSFLGMPLTLQWLTICFLSSGANRWYSPQVVGLPFRGGSPHRQN